MRIFNCEAVCLIDKVMMQTRKNKKIEKLDRFANNLESSNQNIVFDFDARVCFSNSFDMHMPMFLWDGWNIKSRSPNIDKKAKNQKKRKSMNFQCILENLIRGELFIRRALLQP